MAIGNVVLAIAFLDQFVGGAARHSGSRPKRDATNRRISSSSMDLFITALLIIALFIVARQRRLDRHRARRRGLDRHGTVLIAARRATPWPSPSGDPASSWTLTALPLFIWMGEILFRTRLSEDMFKGLAPWLERVPGPAAAHQHHRLHDLRGSVRLVCGDLRDHRQDDAAGTGFGRGYPEDITIGTLAGAGTLGLLIPPSIIMIVYGVSANVSIAHLFIAGVIPGGCCWHRCSRAISWCGRLLHPDKDSGDRDDHALPSRRNCMRRAISSR